MIPYRFFLQKFKSYILNEKGKGKREHRRSSGDVKQQGTRPKKVVHIPKKDDKALYNVDADGKNYNYIFMIVNVCLLSFMCFISMYMSSELPLGIDLKMDFGEKSKVMEVLNRAFAGSVVDKHVASAAIREFEGM